MTRFYFAAFIGIFNLFPTIRSLHAESASGPSRVVIVTNDVQSLLVARLNAELDNLGLEVIVEESESEAPSRSALEEQARRFSAIAALRVVSAETGLEVWIVDRVTDKTLLREVIVSEGEDANTVVALRAAELLRASLMELHATHEVHGEVEATDELEELAAPRIVRTTESMGFADRFIIGLAPTVTIDFDRLGVAPHLMVEALYWTSSHLGVFISGQLPIYPFQLEEQEGTADVFLFQVGIGLRAALLPRERRVVPTISAGLNATFLVGVGEGADGYSGHTDSASSVAPWISAGFGLRVSQAVRLRTSAACGMSLMRPVAHFDGREVASFGRPYLLVTVGIELGRFPEVR